jgi:hypothetical protein
LVLSPTGSINLGFITEGKLLLCSSYLSLGVPNWVPTTHHQSFFWRRCRGERGFLQGESLASNLFYFVIVLLTFFTLFLLASFYRKYKKNSSFIVVIFACLLFSFARMSNPEVEVRTFKQQGGESLKDDLYQISNAHHRCTKKHSTMILLRNFYVGISSWNRYVLDTLAGGNFMGTPTLEACTLIKILVGVPPIYVVKTEITLEEVIEKLRSLWRKL